MIMAMYYRFYVITATFIYDSGDVLEDLCYYICILHDRGDVLDWVFVSLQLHSLMSVPMY